MENYEMLWRYMEEDVKAEAINRELHESDLRKQLESLKEIIQTQQRLYKEINARCGSMIDREAVISEDALPRYEARMQAMKAVIELREQIAGKLERLNAVEDDIAAIEAQQDTIENRESPEYQELSKKLDVLYDEEDAILRERDDLVSQIEKHLSSLEEIERDLRAYEAELKKIQQVNAEDRTRESAIRKRAAAAKMEFDRLKPQYEAERERLKKAYEAQRAIAAESGKSVDPELMERYQQIKRNNVTPPLARMKANRCSGCKTLLPSAVLRTIQNKEAVECETCHRLIIPV